MDDTSNPSDLSGKADAPGGPNAPEPVRPVQGPPAVEPTLGRASDELLCDLLRARELLRDAMLRLNDAFGSIVGASDEIGLLLQRLFDPAADAAQRTAAADAVREAQQRLRREADRAVLGLQVEDVLGQLIDHTHARLGGLSELAAALVGSSRVDLQACKLEYSIVSPK